MVKLKSPPEPVTLKNKNNQRDIASSLATYFWDACEWEETLTKKGFSQAQFESLMGDLETSLVEWQQEKIRWQQVLQQLAMLLEEDLNRITGENENIVF